MQHIYLGKLTYFGTILDKLSMFFCQNLSGSYGTVQRNIRRSDEKKAACPPEALTLILNFWRPFLHLDLSYPNFLSKIFWITSNLPKLVWFIRYSTEKYKKVGRKEGCMPIAGSLDWRSFFVRPAARLKGTFNDYVDKKRWVGGPKKSNFVHVWGKNVLVEIGMWSKRVQN